jgi:integral membrane protein (TIGR01906 family)
VSGQRFAVGLAAGIVTLGVPLLLILGSVRLAMTPQFLAFEYHRPDMHEDPYGFTLEDRLRWGPLGIEYLVTDADISLLGNLQFENGNPMFSERELKHMVDVKVVTRAAFFVLAAALVIVPLSALYLWRSGRRNVLREAVMRGAVFTLGGIVAVVFGAVVAWDMFFSLFHRLFFADGTWVFYTSDTLIRLYPEKFWFDTAIIIGGLVIGGSFLMLVLMWWSWRRDARRADASR